MATQDAAEREISGVAAPPEGNDGLGRFGGRKAVVGYWQMRPELGEGSERDGDRLENETTTAWTSATGVAGTTVTPGAASDWPAAEGAEGGAAPGCGGENRVTET
jgi:hypothetical protein